MSTDYGEKERQFLASLKVDTGRDLGEWMSAIAAENLTHRNEIIDWLRRQGFMFSKASWLERIHNNAGNPIYGEGASRRPPAAARKRRTVHSAPTPPIAEEPPVPSRSQPPADTPPLPPEAAPLDALLAKAKAFRPLAQFVLAEIAKAVPEARFAPESAHVSIARGTEFAVLTIGPRELRLGLNLGDRPSDHVLQAARFASPASRIPPSITHMVILTDARQVNAALMALVVEAAGGRN